MKSIRPEVIRDIREQVLWSDVGHFFKRYEGTVDLLDDRDPIKMLREARALYEDPSDLRTEVYELREQVDDLQSELAKAKAEKKVRSKTKAKPKKTKKARS